MSLRSKFVWTRIFSVCAGLPASARNLASRWAGRGRDASGRANR
jgi:hypothetical protein